MAFSIEKASSLTYGEYVFLLASIESMLKPKEFNCIKCITQYGKTAKMLDKSVAKRTSKGCFSFGVKMYRIENIKYLTCIGNFVVPIDFLVEAFSQYEKGMLPFKGSLSSQPSKIMEIFDIIQARRNTLNKD